MGRGNRARPVAKADLAFSSQGRITRGDVEPMQIERGLRVQDGHYPSSIYLETVA
jgi:hypothetical protein